jgi:hypothetical protein
MRFGRRRRREDLRPTWEERQAALESLRDRLRRQGAAERRLRRIARAAPWLALAAFVLGSLLAAPLLRAGAAAHPELFAVRRLAVAGTARLAPAEVARAAGLADGPAAAPLRLEELTARLARHPWIAAARAARVAPDTVVVRIVERVPAAAWVPGDAAGDGPGVLVDATGTPFATAERADLPRLRLTAPDARACGEGGACAPDPRLAEGVALARAVERAGFARPEIDLDGGDAAPAAASGPDRRPLPVLRLAGVAPLVRIGPGALEPQLERLTRVLADVPESRRAAEIDLRFAGQVVLRPPPEPEEAAEAAHRDTFGGRPAAGSPPASGTGGRAGLGRRPTTRG